MVTIAVAARLPLARIGAVLERDVKAMRGTVLFWIFLLSGVAEPLLYLTSIGVAVGRLIEAPIPYHHQRLSYPEFVAPGLLAVSAMAGAISVATFGFFAKLRYTKIFEVIFTTPVNSFEIALAELIWATVRGMMFSALFLAAMAAFGVTSPLAALATLPATILVGLAFGAVGMGISTMIRGWQDFDTVTAAQVALLLFSGVFVAVEEYPMWFRVVVETTPLYHAVELVRGLALGEYRLALLGHTTYLLAMFAGGLYFAHRQMEKVFRQ